MKTKSNTSRKSTRTASTTSKKVVRKNTKAQAAAIERHRLNPQMSIVKLADGNPRRKGTFGYKSFDKIKNGMTVEQFVEKGGRLRDLHWDLERKHVKLTKKAS